MDEDLYFIEESSRVPASQQQFLNNKPFPGEIPNDDPPVVAEEEQDSYAIVGEVQNDDPPPTSTPTATPGTQDVLHTPQSKESSYPIDVDAYQCTLNQASFDVDTEFIDLDGFSDNVDPKLVPSCSCPVVGDDEVGVLDRDISNLSVKKAKFIQEVVSATDVNVIGEGSRMPKENNVVGESSGMPKEDNDNSFVFRVLKALAEDSNEDDDDDDHRHDGGSSLLKSVMAAGITFPRPRWWPDHYHLANFDVKKSRRKRKL